MQQAGHPSIRLSMPSGRRFVLVYAGLLDGPIHRGDGASLALGLDASEKRICGCWAAEFMEWFVILSTGAVAEKGEKRDYLTRWLRREAETSCLS